MFKPVKFSELQLDPEQSNYWDFDVKDGVTFMNCNRIHPLKQKDLQYIIDILKEDKNVEGVVIFGSATQFRCNSRSDIDMIIFLEDDKVPYVSPDIFNVGSELDIFFQVEERLSKVLYDYGVIVYERK